MLWVRVIINKCKRQFHLWQFSYIIFEYLKMATAGNATFPYSSSHPIPQQSTVNLNSEKKYYGVHNQIKKVEVNAPQNNFFSKTNTIPDLQSQSKELETCYEQIRTLKDQIQFDEKQKAQLQETIKELKKELQINSKEANKYYQELQKTKHTLQRVKIDNKSMEMEIEKFRNERRIYYSKLNDLEGIKKHIGTEIIEKNQFIDQSSYKIKKLERNNNELKIKYEEALTMLAQKQKENKQFAQQLKINLQKHLSNTSLIAKLQHQLSQTTQANRILKQKSHEYEREKQALLQKLGYDLQNFQGNQSYSRSRSTDREDRHLKEYGRKSSNEREMLEIQSFMREIENLLDLKKDDKQKKTRNLEQLRIGIQCLEKNL